MSEATKQAALAAAVATHGKSGESTEVLDAAREYHAFIVSDSPAAKTKPAATPKPAAPKKPSKPAPVDDDENAADEEAEAEDETDEDEDEDGITKDQVGEAIAALIDNDQKDDAIAILKKYGAKSMSTLKPKDYEAVKKAADNKLSLT